MKSRSDLDDEIVLVPMTRRMRHALWGHLGGTAKPHNRLSHDAWVGSCSWDNMEDADRQALRMIYALVSPGGPGRKLPKLGEVQKTPRLPTYVTLYGERSLLGDAVVAMLARAGYTPEEIIGALRWDGPLGKRLVALAAHMRQATRPLQSTLNVRDPDHG